jgi:DinB superfamily
MDSTLLTLDQGRALRAELDRLLSGHGAHADFDSAVADLPAELRGKKPEGAAHSLWEVIEHLRIAQWDMLEFSRDPKHVSPEWPAGYWPKHAEPGSGAVWGNSLSAFRRDLKAMRELVADPKSDLFAPLPHGEGQTLLREALQLADHNAYHVGELIVLRRMLGAWK